jgi:cytochrome c556
MSGKGAHENADELLKLCKQLAAATPPKGDPENWKKRTADVVAAAEALDKGDMPSAESIAAYKKAADCKSCHMEFRPPKKPA